MTLYAMAFQTDLKIKSSGIGGLSDGGVKCLRRDLSLDKAPFVDVGPDPGKAWRSFALNMNANNSGSIQVANSGSNPCGVSESVVLPNGTVLPPSALNTIGAGPVISTLLNSVFAGTTLGGILSYPNKLRFTLAPLAGSPLAAPNGRVMLMILVQELDLLEDE